MTGLAQTELLRTNLAAVNGSDAFESFQIVLYSRSGYVVGESSPIGLAAEHQTQIASGDLLPSMQGKGFTAEIRPLAGSAAPFAYAAVIDSLSGNLSYYRAASPSSMLYLPAVARVTGLNGTFFSTDVSFANTGDDPAKVEVAFLEHDRDNRSAPTAFLRARSSPDAADGRRALDTLRALGDLRWPRHRIRRFPADRRRGADLHLLGGRDPSASRWTRSPRKGSSRRGSVLDLRQDTGFRSSIGLFNPQPVEAWMELTLRRSDGTKIAESAILVPPRGYLQRNLAVLFPDLEQRKERRTR